VGAGSVIVQSSMGLRLVAQRALLHAAVRLLRVRACTPQPASIRPFQAAMHAVTRADTPTKNERTKVYVLVHPLSFF